VSAWDFKFVVFSVWACGVSARRRLFVNGTSAHFVAPLCARPLFVFSAIDKPSRPIFTLFGEWERSL